MRGGRPALRLRERAEARTRRSDQCALDDGGNALAFECRDERFADAEFGNDPLCIEIRIGPEGFCGRTHGFLVARSECAQGMLDAVAELRQHGFGNVERVLGYEIDANAL